MKKVLLALALLSVTGMQASDDGSVMPKKPIHGTLTHKNSNEQSNPWKTIGNQWQTTGRTIYNNMQQTAQAFKNMRQTPEDKEYLKPLLKNMKRAAHRHIGNIEMAAWRGRSRFPNRKQISQATLKQLKALVDTLCDVDNALAIQTLTSSQQQISSNPQPTPAPSPTPTPTPFSGLNNTFPNGVFGQNKPHISPSKTHFVPGETITNYASSGSGAGTEYGTYTSYSANPKGSIETSQWGTMPGNSGQTQIRISPNAKPGKVIIYQTTEGGRPTLGQQSKPHKKIYKTITVVKGPLQVQNHSAVTSSHPQNLEQPDMPSDPPVME